MTVSRIDDARDERDRPMREALQEAVREAVAGKEGICSYAIVVVLDDDSVHTHWNSGGERLRLLGGMQLIGKKVLEELDA